MISIRTLCLTCLATASLGLAACNSHGDPLIINPPPETHTVNELATTQIGTQTCAQTLPTPINDLTIVEDDTEVVVDTLVPGCTAS